MSNKQFSVGKKPVNTSVETNQSHISSGARDTKVDSSRPSQLNAKSDSKNDATRPAGVRRAGSNFAHKK